MRGRTTIGSADPAGRFRLRAVLAMHGADYARPADSGNDSTMTNHLLRHDRPSRLFRASILALPWLLPLGACASRDDCETLRLCDEPDDGSEKPSDDGSDSGKANDKNSSEDSKSKDKSSKDGSADKNSNEKEESTKGSGGAPTGNNPGEAGAPAETSDAGSGGAAQEGTGGSNHADPETCKFDEQCQRSGKCRLSYRDDDRDGYGKSVNATGRCDGTIPAGFSPLAGDCCDNGENLELAAKIRPGQSEYFDQPAKLCGIDWDYDCSGGVEYGDYTCSTNCDAVGSGRRPTDSPAPIGCANDNQCTDNDGCKTKTRSLEPADCGTNHGLIQCVCKNGDCRSNTAAGRYISCH